VLNLQDINQRPHACLRCRGAFKIAGPLPPSLRQRLATMMDAGEPIVAMKTIRAETGVGLVEAKATYEHLTMAAGHCHWCKAPIPMVDYIDCPECRALNIDVRRTGDDV
jgi:hypothetical protein